MRKLNIESNGTFSPEIVAAIRSASPIAPIIAEYVDLRRAGKEFVSRCPFHDERTGSFHVNATKGVFHCHGCQAGGDVFRFVQLILACTFPAAVNHLALRAGIQIDGFKPSPELTAKVAAEKAEYAEEQAFKQFCDERIETIYKRHRALGQSATAAERYLCSAEQFDSYLHELAWDLLKDYRDFEALIEREGLCDLRVLRQEWITTKDTTYVAA